jgi:hypothetical protein
MGLDMYLEGEKYFWTDWDNPENNQTEDGFRIKTKELAVGYWRKHPNLHGYIVKTFADGVDECQKITLSVENIDTIVAAIKARGLPQTTGFFFGTSDMTDTQAARDLAIFERAKAWLSTPEKGATKSLAYQASW